MGVFMCLKWVKLRSDVQGNKVSEIGPLIVQFLTFWHLLLDAIPPSRDRKVIPIHHVVCHARLIYHRLDFAWLYQFRFMREIVTFPRASFTQLALPSASIACPSSDFTKLFPIFRLYLLTITREHHLPLPKNSTFPPALS